MTADILRDIGRNAYSTWPGISLTEDISTEPRFRWRAKMGVWQVDGATKDAAALALIACLARSEPLRAKMLFAANEMGKEAWRFRYEPPLGGWPDRIALRSWLSATWSWMKGEP